MGKPSGAWPVLNFPYPPPQSFYLGEDSSTGAPSWRGEGPLEAGKITTIGSMYLEMANTALVVTAMGKGNDSGLQLFADSATAGSVADNVPNRLVGVRFNDQLMLAACPHSPQGGSTNPGPHEWVISLVSPKKTTAAAVLIQAIYVKATERYPAEYEVGDGVVSGPFCANLRRVYGPQG